MRSTRQQHHAAIELHRACMHGVQICQPADHRVVECVDDRRRQVDRIRSRCNRFAIHREVELTRTFLDMEPEVRRSSRSGSRKEWKNVAVKDHERFLTRRSHTDSATERADYKPVSVWHQAMCDLDYAHGMAILAETSSGLASGIYNP